MAFAPSRITRNVSWLTIGELAVRGGFLLLMMVLARGLGAEAVGVFTVAAGAALVAVSLFSFGQAEVLIRSVARAPHRARDLLSAARRAQSKVLIVGGPSAALGIAFVEAPDLRWTLLSLVPYVILRVDVFTRGAVFKGLERMEVEVVSRLVELAVSLAVLVTVVGLDAPVWASGVALSVGALASEGSMRWSSSHLLPRFGGTPSPPAVSTLVEGLPFFGLSVCLQLLMRSDVFLAAGFSIPDQVIGRYGAASGLAWGFLTLPQLLALALYPSFSRAVDRAASPAQSTLIAGATGLVLGTLGGVFLWTIREPLLALLFGESFRSAGPYLGRLAWALPGAGASMVMGVVLASWHRQTWGLLWMISLLALSVGLNLVVLPRLGLLGAASVAAGIQTLNAGGMLVLGLLPARRVP